MLTSLGTPVEGFTAPSSIPSESTCVNEILSAPSNASKQPSPSESTSAKSGILSPSVSVLKQAANIISKASFPAGPTCVVFIVNSLIVPLIRRVPAAVPLISSCELCAVWSGPGGTPFAAPLSVTEFEVYIKSSVDANKSQVKPPCNVNRNAF